MNHKNIVNGTLFLVFVVVLSGFFPQENHEETTSNKVKIVFREIGNQLLLSSKDSTSLVLPVKKIDNSIYQISFQNNLKIKPDSLVNITKRNLLKTNFKQNYIVEVLQCVDNEVAYSFEINENKSETLVPCSGRTLPKSCYIINVAFISEKSSVNSFFLYLIILFLLGLFYWKFYDKKMVKSNSLNSTEKNKVLGSFIFYPEQNKLVKQSKEILLSKKECELLEIFMSKINQVIKREELTKKVWEDNGVIVGRSLDTYISKLRKKLKEDTSIHIKNIHGVGYKLEI